MASRKSIILNNKHIRINNEYPIIPYQPNDISGLQAWFSADYGTILDGNNVSEWSDRSGNNNHATQTTGSNQPVIQNNTLNERPTIYFNGTTDYFVLTTGITMNDDVSTFLVGKKDTTSVEFFGLCGGIKAGTSCYDIINYIDGDTYYRADTNFNNWTTGQITSYSLLYLIGENTNKTLNINNTSYETVTYTGNGRILDKICKYPAGYTTGNIAEIIRYDRTLTTEEINKVTSYLNLKYNIY